MWKSRVLLGLAFGAALALVVGYIGSNIGFLLLYSLLFLLALSILSILFAKRFIKVHITLDSTIIFKGQDSDFTLHLKNSGAFYYPVVEYDLFNSDRIRYKNINTVVAGVRPWMKRQTKHLISVPYRGIYKVGIEEITVTDFLGIFRRTIKLGNPYVITVYPNYDDEMSVPLLNTPQITSIYKDFYASEDYTQISDIRKYEPHDHMKRIHWKISAVRGEFMVKNFENLEPNRVTIYLDVVPPPFEGEDVVAVEDAMTSYAAAVVNFSVKSNLNINFIYGPPEISRSEVGNTTEMKTVLDTLAGVSFDGSEDFLDFLVSHVGEENVVMLFSRLGEEQVKTIINLMSFEKEMIIYYFYPKDVIISEKQLETMNLLREYGASVTQVEVKRKE